jgi:hypothetical protein
MQPITLKLQDLDKIDIMQQGRALPRASQHRPASQIKREAYKSAIDIWGMFHSGTKFYRYPSDVAENPPIILTPPPPTSIPIGLTPGARSAATISVGLSSAAFAGVGVTSSTGIYGSTTREFGFFIGGGLGLWSSIGVSTGPQYTFIFGGPNAFAGVSWGVGCDIDAGPCGIGAMLLFTLPPFRFLGYSVSFSLGTPSPPVTVTVQVGITKKKPILKLR